MEYYLHQAIPISDIPAEGDGAMSEETWLAARQGNFLGLKLSPSYAAFAQKNGWPDYTVCASEAGIVMGLSPWTCPLDLYNQKKGIKPEIPEKKNEAVLRRGHAFEDPIRNLVAEDLKRDLNCEEVRVWADKRMFINPKYPHLICDPDGFVTIRMNGKDFHGYLEVKTVSARAYEAQKCWKDGIIPPHYEAQCRHAMAVFDLPFAVIIGAWGLDEDCRAFKVIQRDRGLERELLEKEHAFLDRLRNDDPPIFEMQPLAWNAYYARLYGKTTEDLTIDIPEYYTPCVVDLEEIDQKILDAKNRLSELEEERERIITGLYPLFKKAEKGVLSTGQKIYMIECRSGTKRPKYDYEALQREEPDAYKACVTESVDRKLNPKSKNKKYASKIAKYRLPEEANGERKWKLKVIT